MAISQASALVGELRFFKKSGHMDASELIYRYPLSHTPQNALAPRYKRAEMAADLGMVGTPARAMLPATPQLKVSGFIAQRCRWPIKGPV
jgi:hypothetical protein